MEDRIITQIAPLPKPATFKDTTKTTLRVAAYTRVSTDHEDQQSSLVAQTEYYKKLISERLGWQLVQIYVDDGISGLRTERREGFNHMIEDCLAGAIDLVLTKFISRFARNTVDSVSKMLTDEGIPSPCGCEVWYAKMIQSILQNEKYKGDALLQKEFTVDFLTRKLKKNEGELPQYYVKEDHEPIISPWLFDYVQKRLKEHRDVPGCYSGVTLLSSKLECCVCGSMYTPRSWHSTSYNNLVWQCRNRTKKGFKCPTLNVYDGLLYFVIHDAARTAAIKRGVPQMVADIVITLIGEDRGDKVLQWVRDFQNRSA